MKIMKSEPGFPVFREAVTAINRAAFGRLERNFAFFSAVRAGAFCHFTRAAEVSRTSAATKII